MYFFHCVETPHPFLETKLQEKKTIIKENLNKISRKKQNYCKFWIKRVLNYYLLGILMFAFPFFMVQPRTILNSVSVPRFGQDEKMAISWLIGHISSTGTELVNWNWAWQLSSPDWLLELIEPIFTQRWFKSIVYLLTLSNSSPMNIKERWEEKGKGEQNWGELWHRFTSIEATIDFSLG